MKKAEISRSLQRHNFVLLLNVLSVSYTNAKPDYTLPQPQIYIENGNIHFFPAAHKNMILKTNGNGKILFNAVELTSLVESMRNSSRDLNAFKSVFGSPSASGQISNRFSNIEETIQRMNQIEDLDNRVTLIERRLTGFNGSSTDGGSRENNRLRRLKIRVETIENRFRQVGDNPCSSNPCLNGGSCLPTLYGAFCYCREGWEGARCDQDVNECANFAGTDLGCQNGASCVNTPGSFQCQCRSGYFGIHCTKRSGDCSSASSYELCGHGLCINQHTGPSPFTCICDAGWTKDGRSPACTVDVNECTQYHTSCSTNPPVTCINTPGSYVCGPCPPGYTGNGHQCADINECLVNNGGCSVNPMVQCTNTMGSRTCGSCPPGFMGNGIMCQYVGMCQISNGGCHPLARCVENPMVSQSFVQCSCPGGYTGSGMGLHGCIPYQTPGGGTAIGPTLPPSGDPCSPNPCQNDGACHSYGITFACSCMAGFAGQTCNTRASPCLSQPCQNGGTCRQTATGFGCTCTNAYAGDLCERQVESCGGYLEGEEGVLKYPMIQTTYDHNAYCEWLLRTTEGKILTLNFTYFHLEGGPQCSYDYLEIRDGADTAAPMLGRFCGDELPRGGFINSTHDVLHLVFRSDHNVFGLGFEFTWNSTAPICGGMVEGQTHGSIKSPGHPGNYPHNRDCTWQISVSLGKRIQIVFASFQLETHPNCSYDYLEIRDGLGDNDPILEKLCNTTVPMPVTSSGPYVTIRFHSDDSSSGQGFLITFTEIPGIPGCGGLLTTSTAVFSSPHHPQPYAHGLECDWLIRLPSRDERINLQFLTFQLESGYVGCTYDFVEVHDGASLESPLTGRFCGNNIPTPFTSHTNQLFIRFKSDESIALGGFSAKYEAVCGGEFSSSDGILRSPYHPNNYPKLRDCVYLISVPASKAINLQFLDFDIEASNSDFPCQFDYLEIHDGDNDNSTLIGHFCGPPQAGPELITSSFNYLWLRFKTDGSIQNRGFLANYSTFDLGCGGILRNSRGSISSPGHPEVYPHGVRCMWIIRGKPGEIVRLTWNSFSLEPSTGCVYDKLEVYDNSTSYANGSSLIGRYCGLETPPIMTSIDTTLTVIFKSDHSAAYDGFSASYQILNATSACGGNFFAEYGVLKSPRHPEFYPNSKSCVWIIIAPRGQQIALNITDFDMEDGTGSGCRYDYLEIRNGPHSTSPLVGKFCGNRPPPRRIPSFSNSLYLKFKSDSSHVRKGFYIEWDATSTGCGGIFRSPSGSISSPNYPTSYEGRMECTWKIFVNQGSAVQISFVEIDLQHSTSTCSGERVEVLDGVERNSPSLGKFCSADHLISLQSKGDSVTIRFISPFESNGRGFTLNFRAVCNRELRTSQGVIESPNYPNAYPHNRNCTWVINVPHGNKVNLSFSHFEIEGPTNNGNCSYDYVQVREYEYYIPGNQTILGTYCGNDKPGLIASTQDAVAITFVSDYSQAHNGFRLEWKWNGCGGRIIGDYGELKSPGYPIRYPMDRRCIWEITTEVGTKVELTIHDLDIEHYMNCSYDGLMVFGGRDETSPILSTLCTSMTSPTVLTSHGNNMYVLFYSDRRGLVSRGFYGTIRQQPGGCGGTYQAVSGYVYSPNYPSNYDHNDDCSWLISMDPNHVVQLTFEEFDVERHINCTFDHVAVYDGASQSSPLLLMHCGNSLPDPVTVTSTGPYMMIHLNPDGSDAGKGFKAKYSLGCGGRLTGRGQGVITSPDFPKIMSHKINCSWIITGDNPDDRVTLTFTHLDFDTDPEKCYENFVEVLDGEDLEAPSLYRACDGVAPPALTSHGNSMLIRVFRKDDEFSDGHYAFRMIYDLSSSACGGELTSANGSFTSPNYPNGYPPNVECTWTVVASPGNRIQLSFRQLDIESSEFCNSDFVEIHENSTSGPLLGHFCGNEIPTNITAAEKIWILFRTDGEGQAPGFWADYTLLHGNDLSGPSGSIASPMYPRWFSGLGTFYWRVTVNESYAIQISFTHWEFQFYPNQNCDYVDTMTIYDGFDENSPVLFTHCDEEEPDPVISTGNVVYIKYKRTHWHKMFLLRWQQIQSSSGGGNFLQNITGCGGNVSIVHDNATTLLSPGFPLSYAPNLNCEWNFDAPEDSRIQVKVEKMALDGWTNCLGDKVELYDGTRGLPNYRLNKSLCSYSDENSTYISSGRFLRIVFKTNAYGWNYGFNLTLTTVCGGYSRSTRGTISSPNYPNNYFVSDCLWYVIVRPGRTIKLTFNSNFEIYSAGSQCVTDQLILRNGANDESPFLGSGRYCGNTSPVPLETSGNHLFVHFTSLTHGAKGFSFTYEEVSLGCGGNIQLTDTAPSTSIMSPNYPQIPPPYTECEWVFMAPQGEAVQLDFVQTFDLTNSPGCENAGIEVKDGGTAIADTLGVFCREMPGTLKSTGNILYLRYYTNVAEPRNGFKAEVKIATCGGVHTGLTGVISSPGFPTTYGLNLDCVWTIKVPMDRSLVLEFQNFNLSSNDENCTKDKVNIKEINFSGLSEMVDPRNWTFCGDSDLTIPNRIKTSHQIQIHFVSDNQRESRSTGLGFKLKYSSRYENCGGVIRTPTGIIQSPGFPRPSSNYMWCMWYIYAPEDRRIRIEFIEFDLPPKRLATWSDTPVCRDDGIWIYQLTPKAGPADYVMYNGSICGSDIPPPAETFMSSVMIYFRTVGSTSHPGFKLRFTTDLPALCGGRLELGNGTINSSIPTTNTPNTTASIMCEWEAPEDVATLSNWTTVVTLHSVQIPSWETRPDPFCSKGFVKARPVATQTYKFKWKRFCGSLTNERIFLPGNSPMILYEAKDWNSSFTLSYHSFPCGGLLQGPYENITSLNYPSGYPVDAVCIWMFDFPGGSEVKVKFLDMNLDDHSGSDGCDHDYLIIRNGKYANSPIIGTFCGTYIPNDFISMSNHLWIEFHSDGNADSSRRGFQIALEAVSHGCGGVIHSAYGELKSPKADDGNAKYPHNTECEWIIESVPGFMVNLVFYNRFDLENSTNCTNDHVEIFQKNDFDWVSLARFCGRQLPPEVNATRETVKIIFKSNENLNGDGFSLYWYPACGGIFDNSEGLIRSAHYDVHNLASQINAGRYAQPYRWTMWNTVYKCDYVVQGEPNDYILVNFLEPFEVEGKSPYLATRHELNAACPFVNVTVWQGNSTDARAIRGPTCGRVSPPPYMGKGAVTISYNYVSYFRNFGFRARYAKYECGGEITEPTKINSPGNPFTYTSNMNCTWVVKAPQGKVARLKFTFLQLEQNRFCYYDYVRLYDGVLVDPEKVLGTYCGNMSSEIPSLISKTNSMTVVFISDSVVEHGGFEAVVDFTVGEQHGCGGRKNITEGESGAVTITSVDSDGDGKYDDNLDCQWYLTAPEFMSIEVSFSSFNLEDSRGQNKIPSGPCPFDFVEIREGPGHVGPLLARLCGSSIPALVISSANQIWISFATDNSINFAGFSLTARSRPSPCGPLVLTANSSIQYLVSPNYPSIYDNNVRCRWRIDGERSYHEVDIQFIDLDVETAADCSKDRLEIRDVPSTYTTPEGMSGQILYSGTPRKEWRFQALNLTMDEILQNINYCGSQTPPDFFTVGQSAELFFHTDESATRKGFKLGYKIAGCNRTYGNEQGRIFSPEWPSNAPIFQNCLSSIQAPNGSFISLYFNAFSTPVAEGQTECSNAGLEVRDGSPSGNILGQYCGNSIPNPVFSTSSILYLKFFTRMHPARGYDMTYTTTDMGRGCGGNIFHTGGSFTSPLYPGNYSRNMDCKWKVRVPGGLRIQMEFTHFMIGGNCQTDFLEILVMDSHNQDAAPELFTRYCAGDLPGIYTGATDMVMVRYKTSPNNTGSGWRATFKGVYLTTVPVESIQ